VLLTITRQPDANTVALAGEIKDVISDIQANAGSSLTFHDDIYNQAEFINTSIRNVLKALLEHNSPLTCRTWKTISLTEVSFRLPF